jgi:cytochrome c553
MFPASVVIADPTDVSQLFGPYLFTVDAGMVNHRNGALPTVNSLKLSQIQEIYNESADYEDFLIRLNAKAAGVFERPALVHSSGSIQPSTLERPRVILHDAGLLMAFAEPAENAKRNVEILSYNPERGDYTAAEIIFEQGRKNFELNPGKCTVCHGNSLRPVWLPYDLWPQNYGSFAGFTSSDAEENAFTNFLKTSNQTGVYKFLSKIRDDDGRIIGNDRVTLLVKGLNTHALLQDLKKVKTTLWPYRYALIAAAKGCSDPEDYEDESSPLNSFLPLALNNSASAQYSDVMANSVSVRLKKTTYLSQLYQSIFNTTVRNISAESRLDNESFTLGDLRYLLENMGFKYRSYQSSNGMFAYGISTPTNVGMDISTQMLELFPEVFAELKPRIQNLEGGVTWATFSCKQLKAASLKEWQSVEQEVQNLNWPQLKDNRQEVSTFGHCIRCHTAESKGPAIPFDNRARLKTWLQDPAHYTKINDLIDSGEMPKKYNLTMAEKASLKQVLSIILKD